MLSMLKTPLRRRIISHCSLIRTAVCQVVPGASGVAPAQATPTATQATLTTAQVLAQAPEPVTQRAPGPRVLIQLMETPVIPVVQTPLTLEEQLHDPFAYLHQPETGLPRRCWQCTLTLPSSCFYMNGETCRHCAEHGSGF